MVQIISAARSEVAVNCTRAHPGLLDDLFHRGFGETPLSQSPAHQADQDEALLVPDRQAACYSE